MLTVRLSRDQGRLLDAAARIAGESRSSLVREAVLRYCEDRVKTARKSPYEAVAARIGCAHSGRRDLSARAHELFRKSLLERRKKNSR